MEVHLVPPVLDAPRRVRVRSVAAASDAAAVVAFEGIADACVAEALVGCHCLVAREEVEGLLGQHVFDEGAALSGRVFEDVGSGLSGRVLDVREMPAQTLLVVELAGEAGRERLVPLVDEFVVSDEEGSALVLDLPKGMFDL